MSFEKANLWDSEKNIVAEIEGHFVKKGLKLQIQL